MIQPWETKHGESAGGDAGYFQNHSVSVEGVRIGYVGENVLDVGFKDGKREFWGHPGGIQTEQKWQGELASGEISVKNGAQIAEYFNPVDVERKNNKAIDAQVTRIDEQIAKATTPEQKEKLAQDKAFALGAKDTFSAVTSKMDPAKLAGVQTLLQSGAVAAPKDMKPVVDSLNADGKKLAAGAFDKLSPKSQDALAQMFKTDKSKLTADQKAQAALYATMTDGDHLTRTGENLLSQAVVNTNAATYLHGPTVDDKGKKIKDDAGPMFSREDFAKFASSGDMAKLYEQKTRKKWTGPTKLDDMSQDQVRQIVELALPQTASLRTIYGEVNGGTPQTVSSQLAGLLKDGKLPDAEYRSEGTTIPR